MESSSILAKITLDHVFSRSTKMHLKRMAQAFIKNKKMQIKIK